MSSRQRSAFNNEMGLARALITSRDLVAAFAHLERAHVIGQAYVVPHVTAHWLMCQVELRRRRPAALVGQITRVVLGALGSAVGVVPIGNTGGTNISMFKRMPVEAEVQNLIDDCGPSEDTPRPNP
jgi:hypothetical protein